jgi:hypothetical protein
LQECFEISKAYTGFAKSIEKTDNTTQDILYSYYKNFLYSLNGYGGGE